MLQFVPFLTLCIPLSPSSLHFYLPSFSKLNLKIRLGIRVIQWLTIPGKIVSYLQVQLNLTLSKTMIHNRLLVPFQHLCDRQEKRMEWYPAKKNNSRFILIIFLTVTYHEIYCSDPNSSRIQFAPCISPHKYPKRFLVVYCLSAISDNELGPNGLQMSIWGCCHQLKDWGSSVVVP